jgi:AraC family transcriptional regulator
MLTLSSGEYLGRVLRQVSPFGLPLTSTAYPHGRPSPWHVHERPTLFVLLTGRHHDENRRQSFDQSPLSVVYHPTTGPHSTAVGPDGMAGVNVELTDAWLERCHIRTRDLATEYQVLDSPAAKLLGLRLAAAAYDPGEAAAAEAETAALELVARLGREPDPAKGGPRWLPRAEEYLRANAGGPVGLRDVAAEVGVHPVYCARAFRRAVGCTVTAYLRILRLADAGRLILGGGHALADVALRAGFADQAHLTRTCSRVLGLTPGRLQGMRRALAAELAG